MVPTSLAMARSYRLPPDEPTSQLENGCAVAAQGCKTAAIANFLTPNRSLRGISVQNLLKLGLIHSKRAVGCADNGDDWPDTPGAFRQRELHEGANQIPWLVCRESIWRANREGARVE